jgi:hypothetical protein
MFQVFSNVQPPEPTEEECTGVPIPTGLWRMITACWAEDPSTRPHIADVLVGLSSPIPSASNPSSNIIGPVPSSSAEVIHELPTSKAPSATLYDKATRISCYSSPTDTIVGPTKASLSAPGASISSPVASVVHTSSDSIHGEVLNDWLTWSTALLTSSFTL